MLETVRSKYLYLFSHFFTTSFKSSISKCISSSLELLLWRLQCSVVLSSLSDCSEYDFSCLDVLTSLFTFCTFRCFVTSMISSHSCNLAECASLVLFKLWLSSFCFTLLILRCPTYLAGILLSDSSLILDSNSVLFSLNMLVSGTKLCGVYMPSFLCSFVLQTTAKWSLLLHL